MKLNQAKLKCKRRDRKAEDQALRRQIVSRQAGYVFLRIGVWVYVWREGRRGFLMPVSSEEFATIQAAMSWCRRRDFLNDLAKSTANSYGTSFVPAWRPYFASR